VVFILQVSNTDQDSHTAAYLPSVEVLPAEIGRRMLATNSIIMAGSLPQVASMRRNATQYECKGMAYQTTPTPAISASWQYNSVRDDEESPADAVDVSGKPHATTKKCFRDKGTIGGGGEC